MGPGVGFLTANSHLLSTILIDFELAQILMRVDESLCAFDQSTLINSHLVLTGASELRKLSCKLSLLSSHLLAHPR